MTDFDIKFISFIFIVFIGFGLFIIFLLAKQKKQLKGNLLLSGIDIWNLATDCTKGMDLTEKDLIFGIVQHPNLTQVSYILKNFKNEILGESIISTLKRRRTLKIGGEKFTITFPLTWKRTIILQKEGTSKVLAEYVETGWLGKHTILIPGHGIIVSSRTSLDLKGCFTYYRDGVKIGLVVKTLSGQSKGRYALLPESLPLEVRLFMLLS